MTARLVQELRTEIPLYGVWYVGRKMQDGLQHLFTTISRLLELRSKFEGSPMLPFT